jgi:two-component system, OmpR family, phosphate regulon sensor histidine kinase PhoR
MWRTLSRIAGRAVLLWLPGGIAVAGLLGLGRLDTAAAVIVAVTAFAAAILIAIPFAVSVAAAREAIAALGPEGPPLGERRLRERARRLSPAAESLWPAVLRLSRAWREHAARGEARLAAAEAVIAALPDPLILIDRDRRIVGTNAAAAEFVGRAAGPRDLAAALRNPALLAAADAVLRGALSRTVEFTVTLPVERMLRAHLARIDGPSLDGAAAILTLHDITALKRAEEMRGDFIANAGHELKTPLATLIGFIETLLGPARDDEAARERFLGIMREQAVRMARLVDDMLSLTRIELNEHVAPTGRVAPAPLLEHVAAALELRAAERGMRIALALPADLPDIQGDPDELAQVFQNLLDNAVKYGRPQTEIAVTAEVGTGAAAAQLRIVVADQGDGIPGEHLPRLTERFYRVDNARSRALGGTGLGLAIVKHILNRHRGRLEIASTLGQGSTFTVWLRAATDRGSAVTER